MVRKEGFEPSRSFGAVDFESTASAVPPLPRGLLILPSLAAELLPGTSLTGKPRGNVLRVHQSSFNPNWTCRGEFAWPLTMPKEPEVTLVLGVLNRG